MTIAPSLVVLAATALLIIGVNACLKAFRLRKKLPYPPGPPGYPVIGSLLDIPKQDTYLKFSALRKVRWLPASDSKV
jgi:hypothetical protein